MNIAGLALTDVFSLPSEPSEPLDVTKFSFQRIIADGGQGVVADTSATLAFTVKPQGRRWFVPAKSYFRVELKTNIPASGSADVTNVSQLAPFAIDAAMRSARVTMGGKLISHVDRDLGYIAHMKHRTTKSRKQLDTMSQVGSPAHSLLTSLGSQVTTGPGTGPDIMQDYPRTLNAARQFAKPTPEFAVSTAAFDDNYVFQWLPPLGFFDVDHGIPGMDVSIELVTDGNWATAPWEVALANCTEAGKSGATKRNVTGINIIFMAAFAEGPRGDDEKFVLNFDEWRVNKSTQAGNQLTDPNPRLRFTLRPETDAVAFAVADTRGGTQRGISATRFLLGPQTTGSMNTNGAAATLLRRLNYLDFYGDSNQISHMQMQYNGQLFPQYPLMMESSYIGQTIQAATNASVLGSFSGSFTDLIRSNHINQGFDETTYDYEDLDQFLSLGQYFFWNVPKDSTANPTQVTFDLRRTNPVGGSTFYVAATGGPSSDDNDAKGLKNNAQALVFERAAKAYMIRTRDSTVVSVLSQEEARSRTIANSNLASGSGFRHFM